MSLAGAGFVARSAITDAVVAVRLGDGMTFAMALGAVNATELPARMASFFDMELRKSRFGPDTFAPFELTSVTNATV